MSDKLIGVGMDNIVGPNVWIKDVRMSTGS
jgi:hypothetical protein